MSTDEGTACSGEKTFSTKTRHSLRMTCGKRICSTCVLTRDSTKFTTTFLPIIDVLSKHAWPLKTKSGNDVAIAIAKIIQNDGRCPKNLQTDRGKECYNANMQKLLKKHDINHYSTYSVMKASVVKRFNCTLKNNMWKQFTLNGNYRWIDLLHLVSEYNARKHRTIGLRPIDVTPVIANKLLTTVYSRIKITAPARFKWAISVRMSKYKTLFEEDYSKLDHEDI